MQMNMQASRILKPVLAAMTTLPLLAAAHTGTEDHAHLDFAAGFVHPFTGLDHLAVMMAVGLWSALAARRAGPGLLWGPAAFAVMLLAGALLGMQSVQIPTVEPMIAVSLLVTGLLIITRWQIPGIAAALLMGLFAVFHGLAHGYEMAALSGASGSSDAAITLAGMLLATMLLQSIGLGLGWALRSASAWVPRIVGASVAVFGTRLLAQLA